MILSLPAPAAIARVLKESQPRSPRGERDSSLSVASAIHAGLYSVLMKNVRLVSWRSSLSVPGRRSRRARSRPVSSRGLPVISAESISISRNFVSIRNVQFLRERSRDALLSTLTRGSSVIIPAGKWQESADGDEEQPAARVPSRNNIIARASC